MLLIWSVNISSLMLIPSSISHRFHERNLHICEDMWKDIYEAPRYYDKDVQFVILLNMWHLNNMMVLLFSKRVILKR